MQRRKMLIRFLLILCGLGFRPTDLCRAEEQTGNASPYKIMICIVPEKGTESRKKELAELERVLKERIEDQVGSFWEIRTELTTVLFWEKSENEPWNIPTEIESFDKVFVIKFINSGNIVRLHEFDVKTRRQGNPLELKIENPDKLTDILFQKMLRLFSPVLKLENATLQTAFFRAQGTGHLAMQSAIAQKIGLPKPGTALIPFVRHLDRNGALLEVAGIPWTALVVESIDPTSMLVQCRIESGIRGALTARRRGKTELLALAVPTPELPTTLRLMPRTVEEKNQIKAETLNVYSKYDVYEQLSGSNKTKFLGRTTTSGTFVLEPLQDSTVRVCLFKSGRSVLARVPVVRGLESDVFIPISDDAVRLEAEAAVLGIQEEMLDQTVRKGILDLRLKKQTDQKDDAGVRETKNELARLKDADRFLLELEQARLRFHSDDPTIQRRIDKLFNETKKVIQQNF